MSDKEYRGCWPTMITPFTDGDKVDFKALRAIVDQYVAWGCEGIFAVCQSSEMFLLSRQEKLDIARAVKDAAAGRVKVIASGHTEDEPAAQVEGLGAMAETGVDAVVLVSNRLAKEAEGEEVFRRSADAIFSQLPGVTFGMYECPYPYRRLLTTEFLADCARSGRMVFLKDVSCSRPVLEERIAAVRGSGLSIFNANTATLLDSLVAGADGYNGVMANFHLDLYVWMYRNFRERPEEARRVSDFLTVAAVIEARAYPVSAKYHFGLTGIPMSLRTRVKDPALLNENARLEVESLVRMERGLRAELGLAG
ncbi:MAG TPA: dihydrodipicolinate synthase family protein [Spirochaetales bacterium]|nr:dihydrodipicolinate synthase family protein [Spirochaetales bacterium]HRY56347.1 dihydrodipicolinate synthase family protein [Spirochaetia bacterium]HRZ65475.1 dihydrodipicolinate synthase family protein [Spirochaetia bacterium]